MTDVEREIAAFSRMHRDLKRHHRGKWTLISDEQLVGTFDTFDDVARQAVKLRSSYLIRRVGSWWGGIVSGFLK